MICILFLDFVRFAILDQLLNCYFNRAYRSSSCNKQIIQAEKEQGCLEEVFTILPVSIGSLSLLHATRIS